MRPYEEDLICELIGALRPMRCLEWGGGLSTLQFPALLAEGATWTSIEHDPSWAATLQRLVGEPQMHPIVGRRRVVVRHVPADVPTFSGDGTAAEFASYLAAADDDAPYDLIFIDGRARAACVANAHDLLAPGGLVVLHDANRDAYLAPTARFAHQLLFRDRRNVRKHPAGGVWIGGKECDPATLLNLGLHRRVWAFYSGVGRLFA